MTRKSTATALFAMFSLLATEALAHSYYPRTLNWFKEGGNCVVRFWVDDPPEIHWASERGRRIHDVGINWCVAKRDKGKNWWKRNGGLDDECAAGFANSPRHGGLGKKYLENQQNTATGKYWDVKIPYGDLKIDPSQTYANGKSVRYILSVNFYTGDTYHHHSGSHTFSQRVMSGC